MTTDYISREAALKVCCGICTPSLCSTDCYEVQAIRNIPAADVVEVVRCRECIHYGSATKECGLYAWGDMGLLNPKPDEYCSRGTRRTESETHDG